MKVKQQRNVRPTKRARDSNHIGVYKRLLLLNLHCETIAKIIARWGTNGRISEKDASYHRLMVEEVRAAISQSVMERLDEREVCSAANASSSRLTLENKLFRA